MLKVLEALKSRVDEGNLHASVFADQINEQIQVWLQDFFAVLITGSIYYWNLYFPKEKIPVELLWLLHENGLMTIEQYLSRYFKDFPAEICLW